MENFDETKWVRGGLRPLAIMVTAGLLAALLLVASLWRSDRRSDALVWHQFSWSTFPTNGGAQIFSVRLERGVDDVNLRLVAFLPKDFNFLVLDNGSSRAHPRFQDLRAALTSRKCIAGVNGGFFDPASFQPNGQMIAEGTVVGEYDPENWSKGVVFVKNDHLMLAESASFRPSLEVTQLLQTGPWLVRNSMAQVRYDDDFPAPRTFLAEGRSGVWMLGNSSAITLRDLALLLSGTTLRRVLAGPTKDALNLDGGSSSGFWAAAKSGAALHVSEQTLVRNYIGLRPKADSADR